MKEVLEKLWTLQKLDTEIRDLERSRDELSAGTAAARKGVEAAKAKVEVAHAATKEVLALQHRHELELKGHEDEIEKSKIALNKAQSNKEYQGLLLKIGTLEAECGKVEEKILEAMELLETKNGAESVAKAALGEAEAALRAAEARVEEQRDGLEAKIVEIRGGRDEVAATVPPDQLRLYERIRGGNQSTGTAVAVVYGEYCQGCQMRITPQQHADLVGGTTLVLCRTCQRILSLGDPEPAGGETTDTDASA